MDGISDIHVTLRHIQGRRRVDRVRAWARKNRARARFQSYAPDWYEGLVVVVARWDEPREEVQARADEVRRVVQIP